MTRCFAPFLLVLIALFLTSSAAAETVVSISTPMTPPEWALLEREVLRANAAACRLFYKRYFDERGYLLCVERWGGDDGPDDAIECVADWPLLHALGGADDVLAMYKRAWEGHLRQYTQAKTVDVPFARDGMYYREFPVRFDWIHNGEGLTAFNLQGLSDPHDPRFGERVRRFAGFYTGEDPTAPNYDSQHKVIRSLFNGSRGPLLRKATGLDWAGDPIEVEGRFQPRHGERTYAQMVAHFKDYNDIVGDHPLNLCATSLAANAYFLTHEAKYKKWLLEYVDAWAERTRSNGGIIPTNIGTRRHDRRCVRRPVVRRRLRLGLHGRSAADRATGPSQPARGRPGRLWQRALVDRRPALCRRVAAADRGRQRKRENDRRPHDVPPHARR